MSKSSVEDEARTIVAPIVADRDLELIDIEFGGTVLRVVVDRSGGVDLGELSEATREVSRALDRHDPVAGRYTLELSSPGLERRLRTPEHFERAVGDSVRVKTVPGTPGSRRIEGTLVEGGPDGIVVQPEASDGTEVQPVRLAYDQVDQARTVFEWGPTSSDEKRGTLGKPNRNERRQTKRAAAS